ncbi:MAG TPA: hypothetical protein PKC20_18390, partial [Burkholderiaceae bacterium]|nr:hypothetical protein [Burkholderiaceae bacterium]
MRPRPCPPARRATTTARTALAFAALAVAGAAAAQTSPVDPLAPQADARTRISTTLGAELTRGTYGTAERTDVLALPLSVRIRRGGLRARITATGLRIASDGGLVPALGPDASAAARSAPAAGVAGAGPSSGLSLERSGTLRERDRPSDRAFHRVAGLGLWRARAARSGGARSVRLGPAAAE